MRTSGAIILEECILKNYSRNGISPLTSVVRTDLTEDSDLGSLTHCSKLGKKYGYFRQLNWLLRKTSYLMLLCTAMTRIKTSNSRWQLGRKITF